MWTYDGILIEKKEGKYKVFADDMETFEVFTEEYSNLNKFFLDQIEDDIKEDGLYQCEVGYGGGFRDPVIYWSRKIAEVLDWEHLKKTINLEHDARNL